MVKCARSSDLVSHARNSKPQMRENAWKRPLGRSFECTQHVRKLEANVSGPKWAATAGSPKFSEMSGSKSASSDGTQSTSWNYVKVSTPFRVVELCSELFNSLSMLADSRSSSGRTGDNSPPQRRKSRTPRVSQSKDSGFALPVHAHAGVPHSPIDSR